MQWVRPVGNVDGHSIVWEPLVRGGWVLDAGCRGWGFSSCFAAMGFKVLAMDPGPKVSGAPDGVEFRREALVGDGRRAAMYASWSTGEGNYICPANYEPESYQKVTSVPAIGLADLMEREGIGIFEIVKLDVEGSEYDILWNWPGPIARQITVEFHDFRGGGPGKGWYDRLIARLSRWYKVFRHERTSDCHGLKNYWDSVFVIGTA